MGVWLGAQQHPAEAGGSWAVSLTAEMGTLVHMQWDTASRGDKKGGSPGLSVAKGLTSATYNT